MDKIKEAANQIRYFNIDISLLDKDESNFIEDWVCDGIKGIDSSDLDISFKMIRFLLGNKVQRILGFLRGNELNVTELMIKLRDMDQAEISRLLSDLRKYNIVYYEVKGKSHYYRVNQFMIKRINKAVKKL